MKDYRTWWRKESDEIEAIEKEISSRKKVFGDGCDCTSCLLDDFTEYGDHSDEDNEDCLDEQIYAISIGLSDRPEV